MDFSFGPELEAFRQEIRDFLNQGFPEERRARAYYPSVPLDDAGAWAKAKEDLEWSWSRCWRGVANCNEMTPAFIEQCRQAMGAQA